MSPPPSVATQTRPFESSRMLITVLKLRLVTSPAIERYFRIASPFCREMLTPPAKVPTQIKPPESRYSDQTEL